MLAMGVASVAEVGDRAADLALGASSPAVTAGWHAVDDRPTVQRFRDTFARPCGPCSTVDGDRAGSVSGSAVTDAGSCWPRSGPGCSASVGRWPTSSC